MPRPSNSVWKVSIHASHQQRGEHAHKLSSAVRVQVSIHASHQQRGEPRSRATERGWKGKKLKFQSTPRISSEANKFQKRLNKICGVFQSTPRISSEANQITDFLYLCLESFNPRLASAARRTTTVQHSPSFCHVSIHASHQQRGEPAADGRGLYVYVVSIHASHQQRGEPAHRAFPHHP